MYYLDQLVYTFHFIQLVKQLNSHFYCACAIFLFPFRFRFCSEFYFYLFAILLLFVIRHYSNMKWVLKIVALRFYGMRYAIGLSNKHFSFHSSFISAAFAVSGSVLTYVLCCCFLCFGDALCTKWCFYSTTIILIDLCIVQATRNEND